MKRERLIEETPMILETLAQSTATTHHFENGKEVFPCSCGETHENVYVWLLHKWLDACRLVGMYPGEREGTIIAYCEQCGQGFEVDVSGDLTTLV